MTNLADIDHLLQWVQKAADPGNPDDQRAVTTMLSLARTIEVSWASGDPLGIVKVESHG